MSGQAYLEFEDVPLYLDVVTSESVEHTALVSEHPVEMGADVADHVRNQTSTVTLDIVVSNTPVRDVNLIYDGQVAGLEILVERKERPIYPTPGSLMGAVATEIGSVLSPPQPIVASVLQFREKGVRSTQYVLGTLLDWKERAVIGKVIMRDRTLENAVITNVRTTRTAETGDALSLSVELKEIRLVEARVLTEPIASEPRGRTKVSKGRQPTAKAINEANRREEFQSLLYAGKEQLRELLPFNRPGP